MPNWVYNSLHAYGSDADLDGLQEFLRMDIRINKWDKERRVDYYEIEPVDFTYMAIRNPFLPPYNVSEDEYYGTNGTINGERVGNTAGNWYNWNTTHWGVKWDACNGGMERCPDGEGRGQLTYHFESPWGPPWVEMLLELSEQFPNVGFSHRYDEEQGWGGDYEFRNGEVTAWEEWDIPESHADHKALDQSCICEMWSDDPDMRYDDCPKAEVKELQNA